MNGADPCASAVSTDDVRVRHAEGGAGLSSGLAAIGVGSHPRHQRRKRGGKSVKEYGILRPAHND